ncbi:MAG: hypothetical protein ABJF04_23720 [Reichenbachiella sp.]|uniref:hypothetical protein n=1 Tax=Reichenbachiella sp. TaxID=2184521 RepID=UPI003263E22F
MKKLLALLFVFTTMGLLISCDDDDPTPDPDPTVNTDLSGVIEENMTLTADEIWTITGRVIVSDGITLTIEPGTIIKGAQGEGTNASVLMIARGGKIDAQGTADKPIIMTTALDDIAIGQLQGTTLGAPGDKGKWGGLVVLGKAPISVDGATEAQIEGVPATETLGLYGGTDATDNSGTIRYVSIRYGGAVIDAAEGKEINGLTLGGVGSGTTISHVEVFANVDDGVEFFGGSVNVSNVLVAYQGDDAIDVDQAYSGTVDNFMLLQDEDSDEGLEIDGPEGSENAEGVFVIKNGTVKYVGAVASETVSESSAADFKSKAQGTITNVLFSGYSSATLKFRASYTDACTIAKTDAFTHLTGNPATLTFATTQFDAVKVYTKSVENEDVAEPVGCTVSANDQSAAEAAVTSATATGAADASAWSTWTLSSLREDI